MEIRIKVVSVVSVVSIVKSLVVTNVQYMTPGGHGRVDRTPGGTWLIVIVKIVNNVKMVKIIVKIVKFVSIPNVLVLVPNASVLVLVIV